MELNLRLFGTKISWLKMPVVINYQNRQPKHVNHSTIKKPSAGEGGYKPFHMRNLRYFMVL